MSGANHPTPETMSNPHIIVGPNRVCLCGSYEGPLHCQDILDALELLKRTPLPSEQLRRRVRQIHEALKPLVQERGNV